LKNTDEATVSEPQFKFDKSSSQESNYATWKEMNDREYKNMGQQPLSPEESKRAFEKQYGPINSKAQSKGDDGSVQAFRNMIKAGTPRSVIDK
jgi:hypothetical protein